MRIELRTRIFLNFVLVVAIFGILSAVLGASLIGKTAEREAQRRVQLDLRSAWDVLDGKLKELQLLMTVLAPGVRFGSAYVADSPASSRAALEGLRRDAGLDFLSFTDTKGRVILRTVEPYNSGDVVSNEPFVARALAGEAASGFAILSAERLRTEGGELEEHAFIAFEETPRAKALAKNTESAGMALVAAAPVRDEDGKALGVAYAGVLLNRNYPLVDHIRSTVFGNERYGGRQLGTVTMFQWDVRVATNVSKPDGDRAIGTRVSAEVYDRVLENDRSWYDRAFVVNDWYISAYDPIHDLGGKTIGILYVGVLAEKYDDMKQALWKLYGGLSLGVALIVLVVGLVFARHLTGPLGRLASAATTMERGRLDLSVPEPAADDEIRDLTRAFNSMAAGLYDREEKLRAANAELERASASLQRLNANYLDMLGFVSHELKNKLGVVFTAARALDVRIVGQMNDAQTRLVQSIRRSIESAVSMIRNYLDLARIEKGELRGDKQEMDLVSNVVNPVLEELSQVIAEAGVTVENQMPESAPVTGDPSLLRIAYNNLVGNALKYGREGGRIRLGFRGDGEFYRLEVWNEGKGIPKKKIAHVFEKFVRIEGRQGMTVRGTGLGLFITKSIIDEHGGKIWVESEEGRWANFIFTLPVQRPVQDEV